MPPEARLGDARHLQALYRPEPPLDLVPRPVLQRDARWTWPARIRSAAGLGAGTLLVHLALAAAFFYLLSFRDVEAPHEVEIPIEVVRDVPKPAAAAGGAQGLGGQGAAGTPGGGTRPASGPKPGTTKPALTSGPPPAPQPPAASPDEKREAALSPQTPPPVAPPPPPSPAPKPPSEPGAPAAAAPSSGAAAPPKLVAPPPDAARSATQDQENKPANLVPDEHQTDQATHEAKPVAVPDALTTEDQRAEPSLPAPVKAKPLPVDKPAPPIPAKAPSAADKLAAALPMDASAMPLSFRSVLAGNSAAQINAAYQGVVQGRIRQAQTELARTAFAQHMSGSVAVTFTIDDAGHVNGLAVVQSSGDAQLDALALHAIELAAPFPPPPPEAEHRFNKAFLVGG